MRKQPFPLGTVANYLLAATVAWVVGGLIAWGLS